jgi:Trypsin
MQRLILPLLIMASPIVAMEYTGTFQSLSTANAVERAQIAQLLEGSNVTDNLKKNNSVPYIIGGVPANENEFPWFGRTTVTYYNSFGFPEGSFSCGASLIHSDIAISAAHCVVDTLRENPDYSFTIEFNLGANEYFGSDGIVFDVERIVYPTSYDFPTDDIVYYKLGTSSNVDPVPWNTDPSIPSVGDIGTAIGFGDTSDFGENSPILLKVDLPAISVTQCEQTYFVPDSITCTYIPGKSTCQGDSGGPIITRNGEVYGLTSFGSVEGCSKGPTGFTRTSYFGEFTSQVRMLFLNYCYYL